MSKKNQRNKFYYFMKDFQAQENLKGRHLTLQQAAEEAGKKWRTMDEAQKKVYEERVLLHRKMKKYTTTGEDVEAVVQREREERQEKEKMQQTIEMLVSGKDITKLQFFVASVNYYCYHSSVNRYIPAEISIVRFNLKEGAYLDDIFHVILDPGDLPVGYRLNAQIVSKETHKLPIPPHTGEYAKFTEKNLQKAFYSMFDFLRKNLEPSDPTPIIYVDDTNAEVAKNVFDNLSLTFGDDQNHNLVIYSLGYLFYQLRNAAHKDSFPLSLAQEELDRDTYDFVKEIACKFHQIEDDFKHCTLSMCIRKIYIICDYIVQFLHIPLLPGCHVPKNAKLRQNIAIPASQTFEDTACALPLEERLQKLDIKDDRKSSMQPSRLPFTTSQVQGIPGSSSMPASIGRGRGRILSDLKK